MPNRPLLYLFLLLLAGCKYTLSPYSAAAPKLLLNEVNVALIKEREAQTSTSFRVAFISDTHNYYLEFDKLVNRINSTGPYAFVVVTGDITNFGLREEYDETRRYLNRLNVPYIVAPGNHDLISNGERIFNDLFGPQFFHFTFHDTLFVVFNNNNWETGGRVPDRSAVEAVLAASTASRKVLISHVSPADGARFTPEEIQDWESMVTTLGVQYVMHGHAHNPGASPFGTATRVTVGAPSKKVYQELIITPGGITHQQRSF
jgi:predicted phosphodiesterase